MKYRVKATCFWDRYYKKGETVELDSAVTPPEHFEPLEGPKPVEEPKPQKQEPEEKAVKAKKERVAKASRFKNG